jgi:membrane associated rhomboid family serine protease
MRFSYNAPFVLTFTILAAIIRLLGDNFTSVFFAVGNTMDLYNPLDYWRLFSHAAGHANWEHYINNFLFILIIGPSLEEKYGTKQLLFMSFVTALITGVLNVLFMSQGLLGASGIVFMMIILGSFANAQSGTIPLTFVLVATLFLGKEVINIFQENNISEFAHIIGGAFGSLFGFMGNSTLSQRKDTTNNYI